MCRWRSQKYGELPCFRNSALAVARGPRARADVDASGVATHRIDPAGGPVDTFAVTLKPAGGVPAPTGPIVRAAR